ncbi:MAG TPA: hypothetical protein VGJ95_07895 [Pseudonocardiaceae bacterium]|jgi:hypothetical protein
MTTAHIPTLSPLTSHDRCDRCPAAAALRALLPAGELLFCRHHGRAHRSRLLDAGAILSPDPWEPHDRAASPG